MQRTQKTKLVFSYSNLLSTNKSIVTHIVVSNCYVLEVAVLTFWQRQPHIPTRAPLAEENRASQIDPALSARRALLVNLEQNKVHSPSIGMFFMRRRFPLEIDFKFSSPIRWGRKILFIFFKKELCSTTLRGLRTTLLVHGA